MGAQQSSNRGPDSPDVTSPKSCYYEVLGVDRHATEDEIKRAYRKKALELHPDRNYGNVEEATSKFAAVSSAYEVLSDPQERAWYDSHRESILRGDNGANEGDHSEHSLHFTSAGDIVNLIGRFNSSVPFTDAPNGFYGILREMFISLAKEEDRACQWEGLEGLDYPDFGQAGDSYEDVAKSFYRAWMDFSTKKTFSWRDAYRTSDAPDRATRRAIEKENKRLRDEGIREFNDAVRSLVAFVRKRDPRYTPNSQTEADRQRLLREAAAAQAARARAANKAKLDEHTVPDWAKMQTVDDEGLFSESEESVVEQIECVVCSKTFKSEKQYEAHEKSKKHIKAVQQLRKDMRKENKTLDLDSPSEKFCSIPTNEFIKLDLETGSPVAHDTSAEPPTHSQNEESDFVGKRTQRTPATAADSGSKSATATEPDSDASLLEDEYASRQDVETRLAPRENAQETTFSDTDPSIISEDVHLRPKVGKAKAKRAKKLAQQQKAISEETVLHCATCNESFSSKNKLFGHIKTSGHAQPLSLHAKLKK